MVSALLFTINTMGCMQASLYRKNQSKYFSPKNEIGIKTLQHLFYYPVLQTKNNIIEVPLL